MTDDSRELHIVLTKEQAKTTLCTLWVAAEMTKGRQAQSILSAADALRDQIGLEDFDPSPSLALDAPEPRQEPKQKRRWFR
jgi:hypothetical protein